MREDLRLYDYRAWDERPAIRWPGGAKLAFWVAHLLFRGSAT